jgi:hypothetical protein
MTLPRSVPVTGVRLMLSWRSSAPTARPIGPPSSLPISRDALTSIWVILASESDVIGGDIAA